MYFKYRNGLSKPEYISQIKDLLIKYDNDFLPPLSARESSTQKISRRNSTLIDSSNKDTNEIDKAVSIEKYFEAIRSQHFILALDPDTKSEYGGSTVAGFLTFIPGYCCSELGGKRHPSNYVTTVLVDKRYRGLRLTYDLYNELFALLIDEGGILNPVTTRTWDSKNKQFANGAHIHILEQLGFELVKRLRDDRGEGIDTVYFRKDFTTQQMNIFQRLLSTHTLSSFGIAAILIALTILSAVAYAFTDLGEEAGELLLAFATSLLVSAVCLIIDAVSQYRLSKNEQYLMDMKRFGIDELNFDKQLLLIEKIHKAHNEIWLSGCRHILNSSIANYLQRAAARGLKLKVLSSPPWGEAYKLIYNDAEKTINNYIKLFRMTLICGPEDKCVDIDKRCEFRFSNKPFFNDIYLIDNTIISSAFSYSGNQKGTHSDDKSEATAREFFTMVTHNGSKFYETMKTEYETLWKSSEYMLDCKEFVKCFPDTSYVEKTYEEKCALIERCLIKTPKE